MKAQSGPGRAATALIAALVTLAFSEKPAVSADTQIRADQLLWECEGKTPVPEAPIIGKGLCASYLSGAIDMHVLMADTGLIRHLFCLPRSGISNDQALRVFVKWAREHPHELHKSARVSIVIALSEAFPCAGASDGE